MPTSSAGTATAAESAAIGGSARLARKVALAVATRRVPPGAPHPHRARHRLRRRRVARAAAEAAPEVSTTSASTAASTRSNASAVAATCIYARSAISNMLRPVRAGRPAGVQRRAALPATRANSTAACPGWPNCAAASPSWKPSPARTASKATTHGFKRRPAQFYRERFADARLRGRWARTAGCRPPCATMPRRWKRQRLSRPGSESRDRVHGRHRPHAVCCGAASRHARRSWTP